MSIITSFTIQITQARKKLGVSNSDAYGFAHDSTKFTDIGHIQTPENLITNIPTQKHIDIFKAVGSGTRPSFLGFEYYTQVSTEYITLAVGEILPNQGWTSLINEHNSLILHRKDATFTTSSDGFGKSVWTWSQPINSTSKSFKNWITTTGVVATGQTLTYNFINNTFDTVITRTLEKDLGETQTDTAAIELTSGNTLIKNHAIHGLNYDVKNTNLAGFTFDANASYMNANDQDIGPITKTTTNCSVFNAISNPVAIDKNTNQVVLPEWIVGDKYPTNQPDVDAYNAYFQGKILRNKNGSFEAQILNPPSFSSGQRTADLFDIDLDGNVDALTDGLLILRQLFGLSGSALVESAVALNTAERNTGTAIVDYLEDPQVARALNIDGNFTLAETFTPITQLIPGAEYQIVGGIGHDGSYSNTVLGWERAGVEPGTSFSNSVTFVASNDQSLVTANHPNHTGMARQRIPTVDALTDGLIILRRLFGLSPTVSLIDAVANDSPLSQDELIANVIAITSTSITLGTDLQPFYGTIVGGSVTPQTTLTYTVTSNSIYQHPNPDEPLYLESREQGSITDIGKVIHNNISDSGDLLRGGPSSFEQFWNNTSTTVERVKSGFSTEYPLTLIVPNGPGHYSASLDLVVNNATPETNGQTTAFIVQGTAGPSSIITFNNTLSPTENEQEVITKNLAPWGETTLVNISNNNELSPTYTFEAENCVLENTASVSNLESYQGSASLILQPGFGGERYRAKVIATYPSGIKRDFVVEGKISGQAKSAVGVFPDAISNGQDTTGTKSVAVTDPLIGQDGISLGIRVNVGFSEEQILGREVSKRGLVGRLETVTVTNEVGGTVVTKTGPLKAIRVSNNNFDILHNNCLFISDGSPNWSCTLTLVMKALKVPATETYIVNFSGTHTPDYGMEILNERGGTRLNTSTQPLRSMGTLNGDKESDVSFVVDNSFELFSGERYSTKQGEQTYYRDYADMDPDYGNQYPNAVPQGLIPDSHLTYRTHTETVYWEGVKVFEGTRGDNNFSFPGNRELRPPNSPYYYRTRRLFSGGYSGGGFSTRYRVERITKRSDVEITYTSNPLPFNDEDLTLANEESFAIINNHPESMVGIEVNVTNDTYNLIATDWDSLGRLDEHLSHKYDLIKLKVGG